MDNVVLDCMQHFAQTYGKSLDVGGTKWRYYRIGSGPTLFWLTGGLRRAALGFAFMQRLADQRTVIAPDYPPARSLESLLAGFEAILQEEGVSRFALGGQSYGGLLAQAFLAWKPEAIDRLVLSSSGPADYGAAWLPVEYLAILLIRVLPERRVKGLLGGGLVRALSVQEAERQDWETALQELLDHDLTREDVVSHFAVAADLIRRRIVRPEAFKRWPGRVVILSAVNDPTQGKGDRRKYDALFGRRVEVMSLGAMGHTAALLDPDRYAEVLGQALA